MRVLIFEYFHWFHWVLFLGVICYLISALVYKYKYKNTFKSKDSLVFAIITYLVLMVSINMLITIDADNRIIKNMNVLNDKVELNQDKIVGIKKYMDETKMDVADTNLFIIKLTIRDLEREGRFEEAKELKDKLVIIEKKWNKLKDKNKDETNKKGKDWNDNLTTY